MTESIGGNWGKRDSTQTVIEHGGGRDEQAVAASYGRALFILRLIGVAWWMMPVPVLFGRWLVVGVVIFYASKLCRPFDVRYPNYTKFGIYWVIVCGTIAVALVATGALDKLWYPIWWRYRDGQILLQIGSIYVRLPLWVMLLRAFLLVAPTLAWDASYRFVAWRFITEIISPTASSVPIQQARASSVKPPRGSTVVFLDPDSEPPQVIEMQPARIVPMRTQTNALRVPVLTTASGDDIETDKLLDMLEAQRTGDGFAYDTWRNRNWTRSRWKTALDLLVQLGLITTPARGQTTRLLTSVDDALDIVEGL